MKRTPYGFGEGFADTVPSMNFHVRSSLNKFLFALLGLACQAVALAEADGDLLRTDSATSPTTVNQPIPAQLSEPKKDVQTVALVSPIPPKPRPLSAEEAMPATMVFHDVPVGMVARIIGARIGRKVEVETNSAQPISGDYGHMSLTQALNEAAAKAGLAVIDEGAEGLHLVPRDSLLGKIRPGSVIPVLSTAITPTGKSAADIATEKQREAAQQAADEKRIELLRLRAKLLLQEPGQ
jgi:hypothetical protein